MTSPLYLCLHVRDFAAQALTGARGAVAVLSGEPPLERVFAMNRQARILGLEMGMSRVQAESFPVMLLRRDRQREKISFAELLSCAERFSPRIEAIASPQEESCGATLVLDVSGSERLLGGARQIAETLRQSIRGIESAGRDAASVAAGQNAYAAVLAARGIRGVTTIAPGREAEMLATLPLYVLELNDATAQTFATWGIHTLGQLAALPAKALVARVGQSGFRLQAQARGEYKHLLVPTEEPADAALCEAMELEHPVELLEPLLFLLSHMLEQVTERAAQRALAIASVETCLVLAGNALDGAERREHRRTVRPALPERDRHTLLKLIQLDLELHPPDAAVVALRMEAHPARPQTAQQGLFAAQAPEAGRMEILLARLRKLVGEGRVGAPELLDSHAPEAFRVANFESGQTSSSSTINRIAQAERFYANQSATLGVNQFASHSPALRMVRPPRAVAIELRDNIPAAMYYEGRRLTVQSGSGPWRTSGAWWTHPAWCREEWDVVLKEPPRCLRLARDPRAEEPTHGGDGPTDSPPVADAAGCWYVIGIYD
jgi:protein ImuB